MATVMAIFMAWVLQSMISGLHIERANNIMIIDRLSALEERLKACEINSK